MKRSARLLLGGLAGLGLSLGLSACEKKQKVQELPSVKLDLPEPPAFEEARATFEDGSLSVTELRRHGKKYEKKNLTVRGVVSWVYTCPKEIWECRSTKEKLCDPCERPHYYLAEKADDPPEKAIWIVDYSRKLRDWEEPPPPNPECNLTALPPPVQPNIGEEVVVSGQFGYDTITGFRNSRGLLVWCGQNLFGAPPAPPVKGKGK